MQKNKQNFDPNLRDVEKTNTKSYQELKLESIKASNYYHILGLYDKANKLNDCGTFLEFLLAKNSYKDFAKLNRANFCRDRFCPFCADRLKLSNQLKLSTILSHLNENQPDIKYIFLTLTTPNVHKEGLEVVGYEFTWEPEATSKYTTNKFKRQAKQEIKPYWLNGQNSDIEGKMSQIMTLRK